MCLEGMSFPQQDKNMLCRYLLKMNFQTITIENVFL